MGFTTRLELHSQAIRLEGDAPYAAGHGTDGIGTLYDPPFKGSSPWPFAGVAPLDYNSTDGLPPGRFSDWADPGSLAVTGGILVSFFSSA